MLTGLQARAILVIALGGFALATPPRAPAESSSAPCTGQQVCFDQFLPESYCNDTLVGDAACGQICPDNPDRRWSWWTCDGWCPNQSGFLITCYP